MTLRNIFRYDPGLKCLRVFRLTWNRGNVGDGKGYSSKFTLALRPKLFKFKRELFGWILTFLGVRMHYSRSYGGIFALVVLLAMSTNCFGQYFQRQCSNGQCRMVPVPQYAGGLVQAPNYFTPAVSSVNNVYEWRLNKPEKGYHGLYFNGYQVGSFVELHWHYRPYDNGRFGEPCQPPFPLPNELKFWGN